MTPDRGAAIWNERYSRPGYAYGTAPNDFLASVADRLPAGRALCLAEGEGRNAVFLAKRGLQVTAVDQSEVGLSKARALAAEQGVSIDTVVADLADYRIEPESWDVVVSSWCHLPPPLRRQVHRAVVEGLRTGGALVLEAYHPRQLEFGTGGPPTAEMMMTLEALREELIGLELVHAVEIDREVHEGAFHGGMSAVVQVLAFKPAR